MSFPPVSFSPPPGAPASSRMSSIIRLDSLKTVKSRHEEMPLFGTPEVMTPSSVKDAEERSGELSLVQRKTYVFGLDVLSGILVEPRGSTASANFRPFAEVRKSAYLSIVARLLEKCYFYYYNFEI